MELTDNKSGTIFNWTYCNAADTFSSYTTSTQEIDKQTTDRHCALITFTLK